MADSETAPQAMRVSKTQQRLGDLYRRLGRRYTMILAVLAVSVGSGATAVGAIAIALFMRADFRSASVWVLALLGLNLIAALASYRFAVLPSIPMTRSWIAGSRHSDVAVQTWHEMSSAPLPIIRRGVLIYSLVFIPAMPLGAALLHVPARGFPIMFLAFVTAIVFAGALDLVAWDWILRPVIVEVAQRLPADFRPPPAPGGSLRVRVLAAPLFATVFTSAVVASLLTSINILPIARFGIALGFAYAVSCALALPSMVMALRVVLEPVRGLVMAIRRVQDGDYDAIAPVTSSDELGELSSVFNRMVVGLKEREALRAENEVLSRLRRFLAPQIAEAVLTAGDDAVLQPHRRQIAVLFCDLRGFTSFASGAEPEEVVQALDHYYGVVGGVLREYQATLGHFAGDGIMAYLNDPLPCEDPPRTAVEMALALEQPMATFLETWRRRGFDLGYGVGVSYGYATLGTIGLEERSDYTALGSVVNLAARLCGEAASGEVLIDGRTADALDGSFELTEREVTLKGIPGPVRAHIVGTTASHTDRAQRR